MRLFSVHWRFPRSSNQIERGHMFSLSSFLWLLDALEPATSGTRALFTSLLSHPFFSVSFLSFPDFNCCTSAPESWNLQRQSPFTLVSLGAVIKDTCRYSDRYLAASPIIGLLYPSDWLRFMRLRLLYCFFSFLVFKPLLWCLYVWLSYLHYVNRDSIVTICKDRWISLNVLPLKAR